MSGDEATAAVMEILSTLLEWNGGDYHYNVRTALQHFLLRYEEVRANAAVAAAVAGLCLAIVLIGLVAVVQLIYIRRSKAFAVSSALGAGKGSLFTELCLESVLPSFAGGLLGTAACAWYLSEFVHAIAIRQSPAVMAAAAAVSLAPGCLAAGSLAFRIRRLRPLEIFEERSGMALIELMDGRKTFRDGDRESVIFDHVQLRVDQGEFVSITGRSGSGKSTLLHILGGMDRLTSGTYRFKGMPVSEMKEGELARFRGRHFGFVFQSFHLIDEFTALAERRNPDGVCRRAAQGAERTRARAAPPGRPRGQGRALPGAAVRRPAAAHLAIAGALANEPR